MAAVVIGLTVSGCDRLGCGGDKLATLANFDGLVERDRASAVNQWQAAERGDVFREGDAIRTRKAAAARLSLTSGGTVELEENTLVRFSTQGQGPGVDIAMGAAVVHAVGGGLVFATQQGEGQLMNGAKALIRASSEGLVYEMLKGTGTYLDKDGQSRTLDQRDRLVFDAQGRVVGLGLDASVVGDGSLDAGVDASLDAADAASLITVTTGRVRIRTGRGRWTTLEPGDEAPWEAGLEVQIMRGGHARVERGEGAIEFQDSGKYRALVREEGLARVDDGRALLLGGGSSTAAFPGGNVTSSANSRTLVVATRRGTRITVTKGSATVRHANETTELEAGDTLSLTKKGQRDEAQPDPPKRAHFYLGVGDSVTIHDERAPTHVGFRFGDKCPNGGVVTVKRGSREYMTSAGQTSANVIMPAGRNRYEIKCANGTRVAGGTVSVHRDSGRAALPRSAPPTLVDTDGRNYRVLYQNLLPEVTVRWRNAPSGPYLLTVSHAGKTETFKSSEASFKFDSGALREGQHQLVFSAGSRKSKPTNLSIRFDNAAPKARITSPFNGAFSAGETVQVAGVALKGWKAYVGDKELSMDGQARFTGQVQVPSEQDGIVVRLVQPGRGTHYYLRRAK